MSQLTGAWSQINTAVNDLAGSYVALGEDVVAAKYESQQQLISSLEAATKSVAASQDVSMSAAQRGADALIRHALQVQKEVLLRKEKARIERDQGESIADIVVCRSADAAPMIARVNQARRGILKATHDNLDEMYKLQREGEPYVSMVDSMLEAVPANGDWAGPLSSGKHCEDPSIYSSLTYASALLEAVNWEGQGDELQAKLGTTRSHIRTSAVMNHVVSRVDTGEDAPQSILNAEAALLPVNSEDWQRSIGGSDIPSLRRVLTTLKANRAHMAYREMTAREHRIIAFSQLVSGSE